MSALLARAFTAEPPGPPLPPGPCANPWESRGAVPVGGSAESALLDDLWAPRGFHRRPDGTTTAIPRRAVPSAGATYPVQWHVLVPAGTDSALPPGRHVRDARGRLLRRAGPAPTGRRVSIVVTVLPGRTFGRYRHRAWPLWVADASYAVEAVRFLVPGAEIAGDRATPAALAVAPASDTGWWLARGLVPELVLARVELPAGWSVDPDRRAVLAARRSPPLVAFAGRSGGAGAEEAARQSGQVWLRGADEVRGWACPAWPALGAALWRAHREAARACYAATAAGRAVRPVSGFVLPPGPGAPPLLHALAFLDGAAA